MFSNEKIDSINYSTYIKKIISYIEDIINKTDYFKNYQTSSYLDLDTLLKQTNLKPNEFKAELKAKIQKLNFDMQFKLLKSLDAFLGIRVSENNFLFTNEYKKSIVQYFYSKPLNLDGITYFQDISFN